MARALRFVLPVVALGLVATAWWIWSASELDPQPVRIAAPDAERVEATGSDLTQASGTTPRPEDPSPGLAAERASAFDARAVVPLLLSVRDADGEVPPGCAVALWSERGSIARGELDSKGELSIESAEERCRLLVFAAGLAPRLVDVELVAPRTEVVLEARAELGGAVAVGGAAPGVELTLDVQHAVELFRSSDLPAGLEAWLSARGVRADGFECRTDERGRFRLAGLELRWRGTITVEPGYWITRVGAPASTHKPRALFLPEPRGDVSIDLALLPHVFGRVVERDGEAALSAARVDLGVEFEGAEPAQRQRLKTARPLRGTTDAGGRFAIPLEPPSDVERLDVARAALWPEIARLDLQVQDANGCARGKTSQVPRRVTGGWDVGLIEIEPVHGLRLHVTDVGGAPIADARAHAQGGTSRPSDADGRTELALAPGRNDPIEVGARGYASTEVKLPEEGSTELEVQLAPASWLTLHFVDESGAAWIDGSIEVETQAEGKNAFAGLLNSAVEQELGAQRGAKFSNRSVRYRTDERGDLVLVGVEQPVRLIAHDSLGLALARFELAVPPPGASEQGFTVPIGARTIRGRVVDLDEQPLPGVSIGLGKPGEKRAITLASNEQGEFALLLEEPRTFSLVFTHPGFRTLDSGPLELFPGQTLAPFRLERGRVVLVRGVDAEGRDVALEDVRGLGPERNRLRRERRDASSFALLDLPDRPVELELRVGGMAYRRTLDARRGDQELEVPSHGRARIVWTPKPEHKRHQVLVRAEYLDLKNNVQQSPDNAADKRVASFTALLPGRYQAWIERMDPRGRVATTLAGPLVFEVRAGQTVRVEFEP